MGSQEETYTVRVICYRKRDDSSSVDVLMVHNKGDVRKPPGWGVPGGGVLLGESLVDAAVREVFEEAGITILPEELIVIDRSLAKGSLTHINVSFHGPDYDRAMGEITIKNDPGKSVDSVELVPCEDIMEAYASYRNGASPVDSRGRHYYINHLVVVCGISDAGI